MSEQLASAGHPLSNKALQRARGVILNWLLNDHESRSGYFARLRGEEAESNMFLAAALEIIKGDRVLSGLLNSEKNSSFYFNTGRMLRKAGYYPIT